MRKYGNQFIILLSIEIHVYMQNIKDSLKVTFWFMGYFHYACTNSPYMVIVALLEPALLETWHLYSPASAAVI